MPRPPRLILPTVPLHIIQRGNNRLPCFGCRSDYLVYLDMLRECAHDYGCTLHAYVLMTNHVHLLLSPDEASSPSMLMQRLGQRYVQYFNRRHARTGTLWEGRFRPCLILDERYFLCCQRYIELNPVRANMVNAPENYTWSSYRYNAFGERSNLITPHLVYLNLSADEAERRMAYRQLCAEVLSDNMLDEIRQASHGNRPLGATQATPANVESNDQSQKLFPKIGL